MIPKKKYCISYTLYGCFCFCLGFYGFLCVGGVFFGGGGGGGVRI